MGLVNNRMLKIVDVRWSVLQAAFRWTLGRAFSVPPRSNISHKLFGFLPILLNSPLLHHSEQPTTFSHGVTHNAAIRINSHVRNPASSECFF